MRLFGGLFICPVDEAARAPYLMLRVDALVSPGTVYSLRTLDGYLLASVSLFGFLFGLCLLE